MDMSKLPQNPCHTKLVRRPLSCACSLQDYLDEGSLDRCLVIKDVKSSRCHSFAGTEEQIRTLQCFLLCLGCFGRSMCSHHNNYHALCVCADVGLQSGLYACMGVKGYIEYWSVYADGI